MQRICSPLLFGCLLLAGRVSAADPPPDIDAALRERVAAFYQLHVDHKFRQAEAMVAEDSKDYFYESKKSEIRGFRITRIEYAPDFQTAKVSLSSTTQVILPGAGPMALDMPFYTNWKIENGQWCWYIQQSEFIETPFGKIQGGRPGDPAKLFNRPSLETLVNPVEAEPARIQLDPQHPTQRVVTLKNKLPGPVSLMVATQTAALEIEIEEPNLAAADSTKVRITPKPGAAQRPDAIAITVRPVNQTLSIGIDWAN